MKSRYMGIEAKLGTAAVCCVPQWRRGSRRLLEGSPGGPGKRGRQSYSQAPKLLTGFSKVVIPKRRSAVERKPLPPCMTQRHLGTIVYKHFTQGVQEKEPITSQGACIILGSLGMM